MQKVCSILDVCNGSVKKVTVKNDYQDTECLIIQEDKKVYAYLNKCPHWHIPLDGNHDTIYDSQSQQLICTNHGAVFNLKDGLCIAGPCAGFTLNSLDVIIQNDSISVKSHIV